MKSDVIALTSEVYEKACKIVGYTVPEAKYLYDDGEITYAEMQEMKEKLDIVYRDLLCKLPTNVLSTVLQEHEHKIIRRAAETINTIHIELLERELLNEKKGTD